MKKRIFKKLIIFAAAVITVVAGVGLFENYLDRRIDELYDVSAYTKAINTEYDNLTKDKGQIILERSADNGNVMLLGSSELGSWVQQNPVNMFPNTTLDSDITIVGQAYVQSLLHAMKVGTEAFSDNKRVALVVSMQWFYGEDIDRDGFAANFSEYQFFCFMNNERLSKESKLYICERTDELLEEIQGYDDIKVYAWLYAQDNVLGDVGLTLLKPYYSVREKVLEIRDKWDTYQLLKQTRAEAEQPEVKDIDWQKALEDAEAEGAGYCTNNEFYVDDNYYSTYLESTIDSLEGVEAETVLTSKEMEDYEMFLQICRENGVEPYIIIMGTNGKYYDYVGIDSGRRNQLYDEVQKRAEDAGVEYLRLSDKEYEPYFMVDVMHLGWKGWLYVDQQISELYSEAESK